MMKYRFLPLVLLLSILSMPLVAQTRQQLEAQKKKTLESLAQTNKLLDETKKSRQGSENKINLLKRSINERNALIKSLNGEIGLLEQNIVQLEEEKKVLEDKLAFQKADYARLVRETHARRNYFSPLLFILSSDNFSQAYRRFRYLQELSNYRKRQVSEILRLTDDLEAKGLALQSDMADKGRVMSEKEREAKKLESDRQREKQMLSELQKKEADLKAKQKKQQKKADELNAKIQKLVAAEIQKEEERRRKEAAKQGKPVYQMSKDEQLVAGNFEKNKGKLPLPVERGFISGHFGVQPHPVLPHVTTNNKGIYIQTPAGSKARAIFDGVVTKCFMVPGSNSSVIVKHGNYRTVYSNLTEIYVKEGDKVTTKQAIGKIFVDTENDNKTELYLMLYKDTEILNPELWLAK
ncbi:MAG: murein hydrolase activator EnvC family protein [Paludibacteraceae bacterium]